MRCAPSVEHTDLQRPEELEALDPRLILFSDDRRWTDLYETAKRILDAREHVPGGADRAAQREERGRRTRSSRGRTRPPRR